VLSPAALEQILSLDGILLVTLPQPTIVAVAARSSVGLTAESSAAAFRAGIDRVREHPFMVDAAGEPLRCAMDARLAPTLLGAPRVSALALAVIEELSAKLSPALERVLGARALLILPESRPGFDDADAQSALRAVSTATPWASVELGPRGHAGGLAALDMARRWIAEGAPLVVIIAADSYLAADTLDWLEEDRRLHRADIRSGFTPGEAAVGLALMPEADRRSAGLPALARVRATGQAQEHRSRKSEAGLLGEGLAEALRHIIAEVRLPKERADGLYGDINGERHRSEDWGFALLRCPELVRDGSAYLTPASAFGDIGAATGVMSALLATQAWARGYAAGEGALIWSGSDGGLRAAALLQRGEV
jgi:3-oxoacyl-[acyl-carrier-protein] synthase-1